MQEYLRFSAYIDNLQLVASTAKTVTRPSAYKACVLTADSDVWVRRGGTAAIPTADVTNGAGSRYIMAGTPTLIVLSDGLTSDLASFSIISPAAADVSLEWFA